MNREVADRWCERGILGTVLAMIIFLPLAFGGRGQLPAGIPLDFIILNPFLVPELLTVLAVVLWIARLWLSPRPQLLWPPICWVVVAFTLYAFIRYLTADIEYVARQEFILILVYGLVFLIAINNLHGQEATSWIVFTVFGLSSLIAAYAVYQFLTNTERVWHVFKPYPHRGTGTYISPNHLGGLLELLLPMAFAYTIVGRIRPLPRVLIGYCALMILCGIAVTVSRGAWLASALTLLGFFTVLFVNDRYRLPSFLFLFLILGSAGFFFPKTYAFQLRVKKVISHGKIDDGLRFDLWRPAVSLWRESPWWGIGPGHFDYRFRKYRTEKVQLQPDRAHNDFLDALTDWGAVGTALVVSAWALLYAGVWRTWRYVRVSARDVGETRMSNKFALLLGATLGLTAIFFHSTVDFNMHLPANALLVILLMALVSSQLRFATSRVWVSAGLPVRIVASIVLAAGAGYLVAQASRQIPEKFWLARAGLAPIWSPQQVEYLKRAFSHEPRNPETAGAIGEAYRTQSKEGGEDYKELAAQAMEWFGRGMKLNPWASKNYLFYGSCLDWVNRYSESGPYFQRAEELDPNGYYTTLFVGLHYIDIGNCAAAKPWLERSMRLEYEYKFNKTAVDYYGIATRKLLEGATNESPLLTVPAP
jgi:O-antigen ligase